MKQAGRDHAVVLGCGMAGLTAARALASHFDRVTIVDRDELPIGPHWRTGVPQGRHGHGLLPRGLIALNELFDGLTGDLVDAGGLRAGLGTSAALVFGGAELAGADDGMDVVSMTRPAIEAVVRRRVMATTGVEILDRCAATGLSWSPDGRRVIGAEVGDQSGTRRTIAADLVVDATGRGSRLPQWLAAAGFPTARVDEIRVNIVYASRFYRREPGHLDGRVGVIVGATERFGGGGVLFAVEDDRWHLTLAGAFDTIPSTEPAEFDAFARQLPAPEVTTAVDTFEPLDDPVRYRIPASVRRRYEKLDRFPEGLLVVGDGLCAFNPVYGQGMTVAALEAVALREELARGRRRLARSFFKKASRIVDAPWDMVSTSDLRHPLVEGKRTARIRLVNRYVERLFAAAHTDPVVATAFRRVMGMMDRPPMLVRPSVALRVLAASRAGGRPVRDPSASSGHTRVPSGV